MTNAVSKTICTAFAAAMLATSMQPAHAAPGPGPLGGTIRPIPHHPDLGLTPVPSPPPPLPSPPHPSHHHHGYGAAMGLVGGMIIGGAIANSQQRPVYANQRDAHVKWCLGRYRSYNIASDTFMSYSGYRKYCNSPYN